MKKIGIDARLLTQTGVGTYLQNLLFYLDKQLFDDEVFYIYLRKADFNKINFKSKNIIKKIANYKWHSYSEQTSFLLQLLNDNLDLMHFTYFSYPIFYWRKFIATIHDTTPLMFKTGKASTKNNFTYMFKHFVFKIVLWVQVNLSKTIITPTNTVKNEIVKIYGQKIKDKIHFIYEGVNRKILLGKANNSLNSKYKNFFVYVGNFYPHKNVSNLIDAFEKVNKNFKLILIGPDDFFTNKIKNYINKSKSKKRIILIKSPTLEDLIFFYKNARALINPSLSEGFGLPLIEAAYFNTPIIASNIPVFEELWNNNFISFDPRDVLDISRKINNFIDKKINFDYKGILNKYSFEKMTIETIKFYKNT